MTHPAPPDSHRLSVREIQEQLGRELSLRDRIGYVLLLLFDLAVGNLVAALWLTEPSLPLRTQVAFAVIVTGTLAWAVYFAWTLAHRKVLLARQRLIAARIAILFTSLFTLGCLAVAIGVAGLRAPGFAAAGFGAVLVGIAAVVLLRARRRYRELIARRDLLAHKIGGGSAQVSFLLL